MKARHPRLSRIVAFVLLLSAGADRIISAAPDPRWQVIANPDCRCEFQMPGMPIEKQDSITVANSLELPFKLYEYDAGRSVQLGFTWVTLPMLQEGDRERVLDLIMKGVSGGAKVVRQSRERFAGRPMIDFIAEGGEKRTHARVVMDGNRVFVLAVESGKFLDDPHLEDRYFGSFKLQDATSSGWRRFSHSGLGFSIEFPADPSEVKIANASAAFVSVLDDEHSFMSATLELPGIAATPQPQTVLQKMRDSFATKPDTRVEDAPACSMAGLICREFTVITDSARQTIRILLDGDRVYMLITFRPAREAADDRSSRFFDSFMRSGGEAGVAGWPEFTDAEIGFTARFPTLPRARPSQLKLSTGWKVQQRMFAVSPKPGHFFQLITFEQTDLAAFNPKSGFEPYLDVLRKTMPSFTYDISEAAVAGHPARRYVARLGREIKQQGVIVQNGRRVFWLAVIGPPAADPATADAFLGSLQFGPSAGNEWRTLEIPEFGFRVELPVRPLERDVRTGESGDPGGVIHEFTVFEGSRQLLLAAQETRAEGPESARLRKLRDHVLEAQDASLIEEQDVVRDGYPALAFTARGRSTHLRCEFIIADGRLYELLSVAPSGEELLTGTDRAFASLSILPDAPMYRPETSQWVAYTPDTKDFSMLAPEEPQVTAGRDGKPYMFLMHSPEGVTFLLVRMDLVYNPKDEEQPVMRGIAQGLKQSGMSVGKLERMDFKGRPGFSAPMKAGEVEGVLRVLFGPSSAFMLAVFGANPEDRRLAQERFLAGFVLLETKPGLVPGERLEATEEPKAGKPAPK